MRVESRNLSNKQKTETLDVLYTAASTVKGREAMKSFLKDLLTESERIMLGRRILIARALLEGKTYDEIVSEFGVGKDTIQRIGSWMNDQLPGYKEAIAGMEKEYAERTNKESGGSYEQLFDDPIGYLKKKYPLHFLLFPSSKKK